MFQIPLVTSTTSINAEQFWETVMLYHNRPHLVNRKIAAVSQCAFCEVKFHSNGVSMQDLLNRASILYELRLLKELTPGNIRKLFLHNLLNSYDKNLQLNEVALETFNSHSEGVFLSLRILFPRLKNCPRAIELVTFDKDSSKVTFVAVSDSEKLSLAPPFPYKIQLTNDLNVRINVNSFEDADTTHAEWLVEKLFFKLLKWVENLDENNKSIQSLSLVKADEYCMTYNRLKETYGDQLVKEWPKKAGTDPQKYVFEDIAIASYLICLWKNDSYIKFVDCGCGNGLLVYLLNEEGFNGYGIDVRKRAIWDIYPKSVRLEIGTVGRDSLFPECTWIIGNHSDELTPWIPVMALKSSPQTNFFVLPCCTYDFNGLKYVRKNTSISAYSDYLQYVQDISNRCGFKTEIDRLRIPSTKRTCLVGRSSRIDTDYKSLLQNISDWVNSKTSDKFVQRSATEKVRNCTQLEKSFISHIVKMCIDRLLIDEHYIKKSSGLMWNKGGQVSISTLVQAIPKDSLKQLKQECGGLQTLLKNHRYLFDIRNGLVSVRLPVSKEDTLRYKDKTCWFEKNHPDCCFYNKLSCGYKHE